MSIYEISSVSSDELILFYMVLRLLICTHVINYFSIHYYYYFLRVVPHESMKCCKIVLHLSNMNALRNNLMKSIYRNNWVFM